MLPNSIGEPFVNITYPEHNYPIMPFNPSSIDIFTLNSPLTGHYFVELDILSRKEDMKEIEAFQQRWKEYEEEMQEWYEEKEEFKNLSIKTDRSSKPVEPVRKLNKPEYIKCNFNFASVVITTWTSEWDEENEHEIIVMEYHRKGHPHEVDWYNIRMTKKDWIELITKLGAIN